MQSERLTVQNVTVLNAYKWYYMSGVGSINDRNLDLLIDLGLRWHSWGLNIMMGRNIQCHLHYNQFKQFGRFRTKYNIFPMFYFLMILQMGLCQYSASCSVIYSEPITPVGSSRVVYPPIEGQTDKRCWLPGIWFHGTKGIHGVSPCQLPPCTYSRTHLNLYMCTCTWVTEWANRDSTTRGDITVFCCCRHQFLSPRAWRNHRKQVSDESAEYWSICFQGEVMAWEKFKWENLLMVESHFPV